MTYNEIIAKDFDRIALTGDKKWDHNRFYHKYLSERPHSSPSIAEGLEGDECGVTPFS